MAVPARTKIDLSDLDSKPVLRLVPPLEQPRPPVPRRGRHRSAARPDSLGSRRRVATCVPTVRRRRMPVSFVVGLAVFIGVVGVGFMASSMAGDPVPSQTAVVWVQPGDTLWGVAERVAPGYDTEAVVARIRELNDVPADGVLPGQALQVPSAR
jgi:LysM domain-containing protein